MSVHAGEQFHDGRVTLFHGDSREVLWNMDDESVHSVVCDPPYALVSIVKRFGKQGAKPTLDGDVYSRASAGFMGQAWDTGETAFDPDFWREVMRVLKPGGHIIASSGTRTYHRLASAIEDAGFEIRDMVSWLYGSGFPKSHDVSKGIDRELGCDQSSAWQGWGTALKPACEPCVVARKPLFGSVANNVLEHGTGALNIDACRIEGGAGGERKGEDSALRRYQHAGATDFAALPGPRGGSAKGRWPANVIHDGSDEVVAAFPDAPGAQGIVSGNEPSPVFGRVYGEMNKRAGAAVPRGDCGSAARFFYSAKADATDRMGSSHPTVKPVDLMRYFCRLVTPPGGVVLDPFAGTGTTGQAAVMEGFSAILVEREAHYCDDIRARMNLMLAGPDEQAREILKRRGKADYDAGPLFAEAGE